MTNSSDTPKPTPPKIAEVKRFVVADRLTHKPLKRDPDLLKLWQELDCGKEGVKE